MPIDYKRYPKNWKTEIVPRILKRAGNKCEVCGIKNREVVFRGQIYTRQNGRYSWRTLWFNDGSDYRRNQHLLSNKSLKTVVLTVAHLDHDETNHEVTDKRLKAMCQLCHLNYDSKEKYRRAINKNQ